MPPHNQGVLGSNPSGTTYFKRLVNKQLHSFVAAFLFPFNSHRTECRNKRCFSRAILTSDLLKYTASHCDLTVQNDLVMSFVSDLMWDQHGAKTN